MSRSRLTLVGLVRIYQLARAGHPSPCRYWPSCSTYMAEAVERHGPLRGTALAVRRLARCRPGGGAGVDLVPMEMGGSRRREPSPPPCQSVPA